MTVMHQPLSSSLAIVLQEDMAGLTLNRLLQRTEGRGLYLVIILLCLPFVVPVSIPGSSTLAGLAILLLSLRLACGKPPGLPKVLGNRALPPVFGRTLLSASVKFLRFIERLVRPRGTYWLRWRTLRFTNALLMAFMGFLLSLPFPPLPPFTNSLPAYSIILVSSSMMEEDGITIWIAYLVSLGTAAYLIAVGGILEVAFVRLLHFIQNGGAP
jgi:hypothetical protein